MIDYEKAKKCYDDFKDKHFARDKQKNGKESIDIFTQLLTSDEVPQSDISIVFNNILEVKKSLRINDFGEVISLAKKYIQNEEISKITRVNIGLGFSECKSIDENNRLSFFQITLNILDDMYEKNDRRGMIALFYADLASCASSLGNNEMKWRLLDRVIELETIIAESSSQQGTMNLQASMHDKDKNLVEHLIILIESLPRSEGKSERYKKIKKLKKMRIESNIILNNRMTNGISVNMKNDKLDEVKKLVDQSESFVSALQSLLNFSRDYYSNKADRLIYINFIVLPAIGFIITKYPDYRDQIINLCMQSEKLPDNKIQIQKILVYGFENINEDIYYEVYILVPIFESIIRHLLNEQNIPTSTSESENGDEKALSTLIEMGEVESILGEYNTVIKTIYSNKYLNMRNKVSHGLVTDSIAIGLEDPLLQYTFWVSALWILSKCVKDN